MWIFLVIIIIIFMSYISMVNALRSAIIKINEANSSIDDALKKRYDLLTKQVEVVKGYAKHEKETLENIVNLRSNNLSTQQFDQKLTEGINRFNILVENYPELKASDNFEMLQRTINDVEEHLSASRRFYNAAVRNYNEKVELFPSSIIANMNNYTTKEYYQISEKEREDVKMEF